MLGIQSMGHVIVIHQHMRVSEKVETCSLQDACKVLTKAPDDRRNAPFRAAVVSVHVTAAKFDKSGIDRFHPMIYQ
jgi:hypothetical protein